MIATSNRKSRKKAFLIALVSIATLAAIALVLRPILGATDESDTGSATVAESIPNTAKGFVPSAVLTYGDLVGRSVPEAIRMLGYDDRRNIYPHLPKLVGNPAIGNVDPAPYPDGELIVTGACQTLDAKRAFDGFPRTTSSDQIFFSTYPRALLSDSEKAILADPSSPGSRESVDGWSRILLDKNPCSGEVLTIAVK
ncbi:hypothetical protein [Gordonia sp. MMO-8]|uniref:hypothetical protein n=1 Tax=Gordonia sp. MMO-8 TaxID=3127886 RepID=UPI0030187E6B